MAVSVTPFQNRQNYAKYLLMHYEPGANVLLSVFGWLYKGPSPPERYLVEFANNKVYGLNKMEKETLGKLRDGQIALNQLDFSLLFTIVKLSCDVAPRNDPVWGRLCPPSRSKELEHLLYLLKEGRNHLAHPSEEQKNLTDDDVKAKAEQMIDLLSSILTEAGKRAGVPDEEIRMIIDSVKDGIDKICEDEDPVSQIQLKPFLRDLYQKHFEKSTDSVINWLSDATDFLQKEVIPEAPQGIARTITNVSETLQNEVKRRGTDIQNFFEHDSRDLPEVIKDEITEENIKKISEGVTDFFKKLF